MLTPVHISGAAASQYASPVSAQNQAKSVAVATKLALALKGADPEQLSRYTAKLASLLIAFKDGSHTTLETLTLAVAKALDFEQKPGEALEDFGKRLADFILAMKPSETLDADAKTVLKTLNIPIRAFAGALKDPASPMTARLVVQAETAIESALQSTEEIATHSYQHDGGTDRPQTDSLKYRASAPQAALLSETLQKQIDKPLTPISAKLSDIRSLQQQLVKAFVGDLPEHLPMSAPPATSASPYESGLKPSLQTLLSQEQPHQTQIPGQGPQSQAVQTAREAAPEKSENVATSAADHVRAEANQAPFEGRKAPLSVSQPLPSEPAAKHVVADELRMPMSASRQTPDSTGRAPEAPARTGLLAAVAERIARAAGLLPRMTEQALSEAILKAAMDIVSEEKAAAAADGGASLQSGQPTEEPPLQTAHLLKDLSTATASKLQLVAQALILKENVESVLANLSPKPDKPEAPVASQTAADELSSMTTDVPESQIKAARIAASEIKPMLTPLAGDFASSIKSAQAETPKDIRPLPHQSPVAQLPAEQAAQQLLTSALMAFQQVPYPIAKSKISNALNPEEDPDERQQDEAADDGQASGDASAEEQHQKQKAEVVQDENPFAADVSLKRHASDAERAFHMYQKMGGF